MQLMEVSVQKNKKIGRKVVGLGKMVLLNMKITKLGGNSVEEEMAHMVLIHSC